MTTKTNRLLSQEVLGMFQPLPIAFDEKDHSYVWKPNQERMKYSVTQVCSVLKTQEELDSIERHRPSWEPRGNAVHKAGELFMDGFPKEELIGGAYDEWIKPMFDCPFFEDFRPLATEFRMCDRERSIGGSCDALGVDTLTDRVVLLDIKSQSRRSSQPYSTDGQMGGYCRMINAQLGIEVDECLTLWVRPGKTTLGDSQDPQRCLDAFEECWGLFQAKIDLSARLSG